MARAVTLACPPHLAFVLLVFPGRGELAWTDSATPLPMNRARAVVRQWLDGDGTMEPRPPVDVGVGLSNWVPIENIEVARALAILGAEDELNDVLVEGYRVVGPLHGHSLIAELLRGLPLGEVFGEKAERVRKGLAANPLTAAAFASENPPAPDPGGDPEDGLEEPADPSVSAWAWLLEYGPQFLAASMDGIRSPELVDGFREDLRTRWREIEGYPVDDVRDELGWAYVTALDTCERLARAVHSTGKPGEVPSRCELLRGALRTAVDTRKAIFGDGGTRG